MFAVIFLLLLQNCHPCCHHSIVCQFCPAIRLFIHSGFSLMVCPLLLIILSYYYTGNLQPSSILQFSTPYSSNKENTEAFIITFSVSVFGIASALCPSILLLNGIYSCFLYSIGIIIIPYFINLPF